MRTCPFVLTALVTLATLLVGPAAHAQTLGDPSFEALAGRDAPREAAAGAWYIPAGPPYADGIAVKGDVKAMHGGASGLSLAVSVWGRLAAIRQTMELPAGVYEFKVWAKGDGYLVLSAGNLRRRGDLGKDWAHYTLIFAQDKPGPVDLTIMANRSAMVDDATLAPAPPERAAAWQRQEAARGQYGFVPDYLSAQVPQAGFPLPTGEFKAGPVTFREKVVYYDKNYDTVWGVHLETLAAYLSAAGFQQLDAEAFGAWMKKVTAAGAYGTVCVMTHGVCPASVWDDKPENAPFRKYLEAGGRIVWVGDVPFYYMQDAVHPQIFSKGGPGPTLGIRAGWDVGCWNNQGLPTVTDLGKAWGLANGGGAIIAAYPEDVTAVLSGFHSDYAGSDLAVYYLKSFNALYPWSGFIFCLRAEDFNNPANQQSVYRLALYAGKAIEAPPAVSAAAAVGQEEPALQVTLDAPRDRRCYYRGESIPVKLEITPKTPAGGGVKVFLERGGKQYGATEGALPAKDQPTQATLPTADLACGDYSLRVVPAVGAAGKALWEDTVSLCPRHDDPTFFFGVSGVGAKNPYRQELMLKDLVSHGMQNGSAAEETPAGILDLTLKYGLRFGMRAHGSATKLTPEEVEEAQRRGPKGEKLPGAWEGGRPIHGLLSAKLREQSAADMAQQVKKMAAWPAAWPRCHTNDDYSMYYGYDWSELAKRTFKEKTGLEAPVPPELAKLGANFRDVGAIAHAPGIIPDNNAWLQWNIFCSRDIGGAYNKALTDACVAAAPGMQVGPVPGNMQLPLWCQGQYPPHDFGADGFNLLQYYYYLDYWQPTIGNLYWNDTARINNRGLELWSMPDCAYQPSPTYYTNTFFLQVAGGVQGINYYTYTEAIPVAWDSIGKIANTIVKPLYPFLGKLRPARTSVGLLLPYTQWCYNWLYPTSAVYPYANLLGAQADVQPTCEEEVLSGDAARYKVLLLWRVQYLRQSVVTALENYIAKGGVVICDATTQVPIKGAIKSSVDLAMGDGKSNPDPNDPRLGGPGIMDYLHPEVVSAVRKGLEPYAQPWADCADPTLITRRHEYHGVTYLWLVNIESQADYEYVRPRLGAGARPEDPEKAKQEAVAYLAQRAAKRFQPLVTIPAGNWAAYDVLQGKRITLNKAGGRLGFQADMEALGGQLVALYPEPIARVAVEVGKQITRGQSVPLTVRVLGASGKPLAGTQPLAVEVITPAGTWVELTGAHATEDGVWTATLNPAVNDAAGPWRVLAREVSSGMRGEAGVAVK